MKYEKDKLTIPQRDLWVEYAKVALQALLTRNGAVGADPELTTEVVSALAYSMLDRTPEIS